LPPTEAAHKEAILASIPDMARELQELLGQRGVAYTTGVRSPKAVGRWLTGTPPHPNTLKKLRNLYRTVLILRESYGPETIRAWLEGANPDLGDCAPIDALRQGREVDVFHAAEGFTS
jgi:hypothetical protein